MGFVRWKSQMRSVCGADGAAKKERISAGQTDRYAFAFLRFWRAERTSRIAKCGYTPTKRGFPKGAPLAHNLWNKGVVCCTCCYGWRVKWGCRMMDTLVLSGRKADRFLRMGMSKKPVRFQKWQRVYEICTTRCCLPHIHQPVFFFLIKVNCLPIQSKISIVNCITIIRHIVAACSYFM